MVYSGVDAVVLKIRMIGKNDEKKEKNNWEKFGDNKIVRNFAPQLGPKPGLTKG